MTLRFLSTAAFLFGASCATTTIAPSVKAENASAAIRAAEEVGAAHSPAAALHLQLAKEQFEHARALTSEEDRDRADRLLMRAQVDAELSLALARTETGKAEAQGEINKVKTLKSSATQ